MTLRDVNGPIVSAGSTIWLQFPALEFLIAHGGHRDGIEDATRIVCWEWSTRFEND